MAEDRTIYTEQGEPIKWFNITADSFLDKTTLVFGGSGSGKTTIIEEILYLCKNYIPNYIVIAPRTSDTAYKSKLPARCIKEDLTKIKLQKIWNRQYNITQLYNTANDVTILESLFNKYTDKESYTMIQAITTRTQNKIAEIQRNNRMNFGQKRSQKGNITNRCTREIKKIYRRSIRKNRQLLEKKAAHGELTDKERVALEYLDINPRLMMIIDDSTEKFQMWMKYFKKCETNPFESIFYKGRWNFITLVFAAHDDKVIVPELRKNARVTYYTTSQALMASLNKTQSGFTAQEKKFAQRCASILFVNEDSEIKSHQKLCYIREDMSPWRYVIANLYPEFNLGCSPLLELTQRMPKLDDGFSNNPFLKGIVDQKKTHKGKKRKYISASKKKKYG